MEIFSGIFPPSEFFILYFFLTTKICTKNQNVSSANNRTVVQNTTVRYARDFMTDFKRKSADFECQTDTVERVSGEMRTGVNGPNVSLNDRFYRLPSV